MAWILLSRRTLVQDVDKDRYAVRDQITWNLVDHNIGLDIVLIVMGII